MSKVENRVVRMTFDNAQFEKNIKNTMNTLTDFEKKLKLDGAAAGFNKLKLATDKLNLSAIGDKANKEASRIGNATSEIFKSITSIGKASDSVDLSGLGNAAQDATYDVNNAVSNVDFSPITEGVNDAANSFNVLETVATGALLGLGNQIQNAGLNLAKKVKDMFLDPVKDGFKEYETQMGSIQTIMANTGMNFDSDDDIGVVNEKLDELNTYADKTIYNFTEMTKNIGTFTAAGVDLETATKSIQGIANLAALSGSNSQQASTAMYQLSQALAAGSLKLQDWNSVVNAGMGGKVFQEALKTTARVHGVAVDEIIADAGSFRESLSQEWISSEILTETLNHMAISYKEASMADEDYKKAFEDLVSQGYEEEQAKEILKLAKAAEQSATQVRTWSQLWDTVKEAIGSNWSQIWRNVIGDFKQATDTFTFLSQQISGGIDAMLGGIVHASEMFNKSGAIEIIFGGFVRNEDGSKVYDELTGEAIRIKGAIDFLFEAVAKPLGAIRDAFETVFFVDDDTLGIAMVKIAMEFTNFAKSLVISDDAATAIRNVFEGLFSVVKMGITIVSDAVGIFFSLVDVLRTFLAPILDIVLTIFGQVGRIVMWVVDRVLEIRDAFVYLLEPIGDVVDFVKNLITALFGFADIPGKITGVNNVFLEILSTLWKFIDIPGKIRFIGDALRAVFGFIGDLTGWNKAVEETNQIFQQTGESVSVFDVWIKNLLKNPVIAFFKGIFDAVSGLLNPLRDLYDSIFNVTELGEEGEEAVVVLGEAKSSILDILSPLGEMVKLIVGGLGLGIGVIFNLISGFVEFGRKIGEAFIAWKPIQNIINKLIEFKDDVIGYFLSLPEKFSGAVTSSSGPVYSIVSLFEGAFSKIQKVADYFSNVTIDQFVNDVRQKIDSGIGGIRDFIKYITNTPFDKKIGDAFGLIGNAVERLKNPLSIITTKIESFFPQLNGTLTDGLNHSLNVVQGKIKWLTNYLKWVSNNTSGIPEFIKTVLDDARKAIVNKFEEIKKSVEDFVSNFNIIEVITNLFHNAISFVADNISPILYKITGKLEEWFPSLEDSLSSKVPGIVNSMVEGLLGIRDFFLGIADTIKKVKDESDSLPDFLFNIFGIINSYISDKLSGIRETISNFDLAGAVWNVIGNVQKAIGNAGSFITGIFSNIPGTFGDFFGNVHGFFENLKSEAENGSNDIPEKFRNTFNGIRDAAANGLGSVTDRLSNLPGFFGTFFEKIHDFFQNLKTEIENGTLDIPGKLKEMIGNAKDAVVNGAGSISESLSNLPGSFGTTFGKLHEFFEGVKQEAKNGAKDIPGEVGGIFENIKNTALEGGSKISNALSNLPGSFGKLFGGVHELFNGLKTAMDQNAKEIPESVEAIAGGVDQAAEETSGGMTKLWGNFNIKSIPDFLGDLIKNFKEYWSTKIDELLKNIRTIPDKFLSIFEYMQKIFNTGVIDKFIQFFQAHLLNQIFKSVKVMIGSVTGLMNGLKNLSNAAAKYINNKEKNESAQRFRSMAISVAIIAGSITAAVALISLIPNPEKAIGTLAACAGIIIIMQLLSGLIEKALPNGADALMKATGSITIFAVGLLALMFSIEKLTAFDFGANLKGIIAAGVILAALTAIATKVSKKGGSGGKEFLSIAVGLVVLSAGMNALVPALQGLSEIVQKLAWYDAVQLGLMMAAIGGFVFLLSKALAEVGNSHPIAAAVGLIMISVAIGMLADAVGKLTHDDMGPTIAAAAALLGFMYGIYKITKDVKATQLLAAGVALMVFGVSVNMLSNSLDMLGKNNWESLAAAGAALGVLLFAIYELAKKSKAGDLLTTSGALIVFGAALGVMSLALMGLSVVDPGLIWSSTLAIAALIAVFGGLAKITGEMDLMATSTALVVFGASVAELSLSLMALTLVDPGLIWSSTLAIAALIAVFGGLAALTNGVDLMATSTALVVFGAAVAELSLSLMALTMFDPGLVWSSVGAFAALIAVFWAFSTLTLGADLLATGAALLEFGATLTMIAGAIWILVDAFNNFPSEEKMYDVGRALTSGLGKGIIDGFQDVFDAIVNLFKHIIDTFLGLFGIHSPSKVMEEQVGQFIPEGIAQGILGGEGSTDNAISGIFDGIKTKAGEFLAGLPEWFNTTALPFLQQTITNFTTWFQNEGWPMIQQKAAEAWDWIQNEGWPKVQEFFGNAANWFATEGWPMIQQKLKEFWDWLSTEGWPAFCDWVKNTAWPAIKNFFGGIGEWFKTDGWPMIKQAVKDFWHWLSTEAWPAFCDWVKNTLWPAIKDLAKKFWDWLWNTALPKLGEWLKSLPGKLRNWWENDGRKMVGDAIKGLMDKAAEIKDRIIEWAAGIPGHIGEGLGKIWDKIKEKGSEIASGIAKGLVEGITHFPESVAQFGSNVVDAIKHFFGINSPSKLMRDEVGVYLPQGIAEGLLKGIPDATKAMGVLGDSVMAAAQSSMGDLSQFGSINTPTISPVVDMSQFNSSMSQVKDFGNTSSITGTLELTSNKLNKGIKANQSGITALGDGIVEVGSGITEISGTLGSSYNSISGQLGNAEDAIVVLDDDVVSMGTSTAAATANSTDAILSAMNEEKATLNDISKKVGNLDSSFTHYTDYWIYMMDRELAGIDLTTGEIADMLKEGKLNVYIDSGELVGAIAEKMDQSLGYRQVGAQRGMY